MKALTKQQLAQLYFKGLPPHQATNRMALWIKRCKPLVEALEKLGYIPRQRILTPQQVACIFQYLGVPDGYMEEE